MAHAHSEACMRRDGRRWCESEAPDYVSDRIDAVRDLPRKAAADLAICAVALIAMLAALHFGRGIDQIDPQPQRDLLDAGQAGPGTISQRSSFVVAL